MEFIENNYVLIIVIGVIVLMTIIGYFADKMETKEKQPKVKKKKEKKNQIMEQVPEMEVQNVEGELPPEWDENHKAVDEEQEIMNIEGTGSTDEWNELPTEPVEVSFDETTPNVEENELDGTMFDFGTDDMFVQNNESSEIPEVEIDNNVEVSETEENVNNEEAPIEFNESVESNDEVAEEDSETIEEVIPEQIDELNNLEITLPDIQTLNDEENKSSDDEDVWKF